LGSPKIIFFFKIKILKKIKEDKQFGWQEQVKNGFKCINERWRNQSESLTKLDTQLQP
jgi:hypothetical protein